METAGSSSRQGLGLFLPVKEQVPQRFPQTWPWSAFILNSISAAVQGKVRGRGGSDEMGEESIATVQAVWLREKWRILGVFGRQGSSLL